jgi:hypothetical protein
VRSVLGGRKTRSYVRIIVGLWATGLLTMAVSSWREMWAAPSGGILFLPHAGTGAAGDWVLLPLLVGLATPVVLAAVHRPTRSRLVKSYASVDYLLPASNDERLLFAGVAITAGVCEEFAYRGFVIRTLQASPWAMSLSVSLLVSSRGPGKRSASARLS